MKVVIFRLHDKVTIEVTDESGSLQVLSIPQLSNDMAKNVAETIYKVASDIENFPVSQSHMGAVTLECDE